MESMPCVTKRKLNNMNTDFVEKIAYFVIFTHFSTGFFIVDPFLFCYVGFLAISHASFENTNILLLGTEPLDKFSSAILSEKQGKFLVIGVT